MITMIQERHIKPGKHEELKALQRQLRQTALGHPGFISGEALIDVDDPDHQIVTAAWRTLDDWKAWERDEAHRELARKMRWSALARQRFAWRDASRLLEGGDMSPHSKVQRRIYNVHRDI